MKEKWTFGVGMIYLVLGLIADMCVPIYIGFVTDDISKNKSDNLPYYTAGILLIIGVRTIHFTNCNLKDWKYWNWLSFSSFQFSCRQNIRQDQRRLFFLNCLKRCFIF